MASWSVRSIYDCRRSRAVGLKIGLVWFVSLLVTSPLIAIGVVRPDEIMSRDDLQCSITNRPFLVYGSLTAYFFPLGVMLVAYTASIRQLRRQAVETRLRWGAAAGNGNDDPGNLLRRSRSGHQHTSAAHSGNRTPELYACRFRRDECASRSLTGSVGESFRYTDAMQEHDRQQRSLISRHDRSLLSGDDGRVPSTSWTPSSTLASTEPTIRADVATDHALTDSGATGQTRRSTDKFGTLTSDHSFGDVERDAVPPDRRQSGNACAQTLPPVDRNSLRDDMSRDVSRDLLPPTAASSSANAARTTTAVDVVASIDDDSPRSVAHASGRRFRSLVQKHASTILAAGELLLHHDDARQQRSPVATAVAAVAAIRTVRTERKAARVIGAVFAVFVACWTPFFVLNLSLGVCGPTCRQVVTGGGSLYPVFLWLGYVASTLNPIVYTAFNGTFRRTFADLITCRRVRSRRPPYAASRTASRRQQDSAV